MGLLKLILIFGMALVLRTDALPSGPSLQAAINKFSSDLYHSLSESSKGKNIFCSPFSLHAALSMLYQGSKEGVKDALGNALHVADPGSVANSYSSVMQRLNSLTDITLHIANKIYVREGYSINPSFVEIVKDKFSSEVESIDMSDGVAASGNVNKWVEGKTNNKIRNFCSEKDFDEYSRLILLNAIYFKGSWAQSFDVENTKVEKFHLNKDETIDVQMMETLNKFQYKHDARLGASILELPYKNKEYSMLFVLPDNKDGIEELESKLRGVDMNTVKLNQLHYVNKVTVSIPKFKMEFKMDLENALKELGLKIIFEDNNKGLRELLTDGRDLKVTKAIQKTFIEVNEEGAEAAAATGLFVSTGYSANSQPEYIPEFIADHPFIFYILSTKESEDPLILFQGKVLKPEYH